MIFVTIPHSGTRETIDLFRMHIRPIREAGPDDVGFAHCEDAEMDWIDAYRGPIVTTYRPEADIRASWLRRDRDIGELDMYLTNYRRLLERHPYVIQLGDR